MAAGVPAVVLSDVLELRPPLPLAAGWFGVAPAPAPALSVCAGPWLVPLFSGSFAAPEQAPRLRHSAIVNRASDLMTNPSHVK
jgi:hypothetical protein